MCAYSIGVDLGGTNLRTAAIDQNGKVLDKVTGPADYSRGPDWLIGHIVSTVKDLRARFGDGELRGIGIGVPGFIDLKSGTIMVAANLPGFEGFPIRESIQASLGIPIILENDANAAALGEKWMGGGRQIDDLVLITLGTGIGGGIIVGGRVLHGFMGMAGEVGHMTVYPNGNPCGCGNFGCLEKHASATAITGMARIVGLGDQSITSEQVFQYAIAGNHRAIMVFESMGRALGIALANLINLFNFPLYLLSGGPIPAWEFFAPTMFAEITRRSSTYLRGGTRIEKASLGGDAGLFGAAYLPFLSGQHTGVME